MEAMSEIVQGLLIEMKELGFSKYKIAKMIINPETGKPITWMTVHAWQRGWWKPEPAHLNALQILYIQELDRRGKTPWSRKSEKDLKVSKELSIKDTQEEILT